MTSVNRPRPTPSEARQRRARLRALTGLGSLAALVTACSVSNPNARPTPASTATVTTNADAVAMAALTGVRVRFHADDHFPLATPRSDTACAGDTKTFYDPFSRTSDGPSPLPASALIPEMTIHPSFIKNVSVDLTHANTPTSESAPNAAYACSFGDSTLAPAPSDCATFDTEATYDTGFYTFLDHRCEGAGPISTPDPALSRLLAGGIYFDLDRTELGENENLVLHVTYIPLGTSNSLPSGTPDDLSHPSYPKLNASETARFKVHLVKTGLTAFDQRATYQPRFLTFADTERYPQVVKTLAILAPPTGQPREEQLLIPLSLDPAIDRIRVERHSGSGILVQAALFKAGTK
ncbi:MAG: hypothetical protein NDJ90_06340 [Oligoflexia bacterium]|nr:hypothetical protein [Oligoflexia bacterium]